MKRFTSLSGGSSRWRRHIRRVTLSVALLVAEAGLVQAGGAAELSAPMIAEDFKTKLGNADVHFRAEYECKGDSKAGTGCSAGCGSASFSPIVRLTIILLSLRRETQVADMDMLYYLAQFPQPASKKTPAAKAVTRAEGFIFNPALLCGTVNMTMTVYDKWPK